MTLIFFLQVTSASAREMDLSIRFAMQVIVLSLHNNFPYFSPLTHLVVCRIGRADGEIQQQSKQVHLAYFYYHFSVENNVLQGACALHVSDDCGLHARGMVGSN